MKTAVPTDNQQRPAFELKGSLFTLTILQLKRTDLVLIDQQLLIKINQAPSFFQNAPVVIDLSELTDKDKPLDFAALSAILRSRGMVPVGIRNGTESLQTAARMAGLSILPDHRATATRRATPAPAQMPSADQKKTDEQLAPDIIPGTDNTSYSRLFTQPIRSGQQIYAPKGDLIVLGAVSNGAEVLADGNIHIYGPLRGRALAGVKGDNTARIFCHSLEAQLISIAGNYRILDEPDEAEKNKPKQIFLTNEKLMIEQLAR
ncbi:MAG: septum site-determining protein MinC [Candidatus Competibacteraceae bacterium]|nr:septum site-determining protein MinC [Candidatus Competibacteraceae bacterium]